MKLVYLYIDKYRHIEEVGFNLSSDYTVSLQNIGGIKELKILKNGNGLPHLFHKSILDIKGVVGENGAGKSTLIDFLMNECFQDIIYFKGEGVTSGKILVYENTNGRLKIVAGKEWEFSTESFILDDEINFEFDEDYEELENELYWGELKEAFNKTKFIHYSNVFDRKTEEEVNGLINITTNYLASKDSERRTNGKRGEAELHSHRMQEMTRQRNFVRKYIDKVPFNLPQSLTININTRIFRELSNNKKKYDLDQPVEFEEDSFFLRISNWLNLTEGRRPDSFFGRKEDFLTLLEQVYYSYFIINVLLSKDYPYDNYRELAKKLFSEIISNVDSKQERMLLIERAKEYESQIQFKEVKVGFNLWSSRLITFDTLFKHIENEMNGRQFLGAQLTMGFSDSDKLEKLYKETVELTDYLDFGFPGLSSGELGFLTLFSRFESLNNKFLYPNQEIEKADNLIITIDEGDLYFHPKWQAKFIYFLNEIFPLIFKEKKMQIIVTSHSQFIASDLPVENLLFLKKNKDDKTEVASGLNNSFGANIHDLLSDAFFLEGAHIGGFAKNILYKVLDDLEEKSDPANYNEDQLQSIINSVGEDWIRAQLQDKLDFFKLKHND